jgi:hypothetical protein
MGAIGKEVIFSTICLIAEQYSLHEQRNSDGIWENQFNYSFSLSHSSQPTCAGHRWQVPRWKVSRLALSLPWGGVITETQALAGLLLQVQSTGGWAGSREFRHCLSKRDSQLKKN